MASNFKINKEDPYSILGINRSATHEEIKQAYHKKAIIYHPDKNVNSSDDLKELRNMQMKQLTSAYKLLVNDRARADELNENNREDSYDDDIRINNGYLVLKKRFSDIFRKDNLENASFEYSLEKDLNLMSDERFNDYKKIYQKIKSNVDNRSKCEKCSKSFNSLRKKHLHQTMLEHTRYLDRSYLINLDKPDKLLESSNFPINVSIYHSSEWQGLLKKKEIFEKKTFIEANKGLEVLSNLTNSNDSNNLINNLVNELNHIENINKNYESLTDTSWLNDEYLNKFLSSYKNDNSNIISALNLRKDLKSVSNNSINNSRKPSNAFIFLNEIKKQDKHLNMEHFNYKVGKFVENIPKRIDPTNESCRKCDKSFKVFLFFDRKKYACYSCNYFFCEDCITCRSIPLFGYVDSQTICSKCVDYHRKCETRYWLFYLATIENKLEYLIHLYELLKFSENSKFEFLLELFQFYELNAPIFLPILCLMIKNQEKWNKFISQNGIESISNEKIDDSRLLKVIDFKYRLLKEKNETRSVLNKLLSKNEKTNQKILSVYKRTVDQGEKLWNNYLDLSYYFFDKKQIDNAICSLIACFRSIGNDDLVNSLHFENIISRLNCNEISIEIFIFYLATYYHELKDKSVFIKYALDLLIYLDNVNKTKEFSATLTFLNLRFNLIQDSKFLSVVSKNFMKHLNVIIKIFVFSLNILNINCILNLVEFMFNNCNSYELINLSMQLISYKLPNQTNFNDLLNINTKHSVVKTLAYGISLFKKKGMPQMENFGDKFKDLNMIDFACFCYIIDDRLDLIEENLCLNLSNPKLGAEFAMAKCLFSNKSSISILNVIDCFIETNQFREFCNKLLFSILINYKSSIKQNELNYAIETLIKLTKNSALSIEYINNLLIEYRNVSLEPIFLKYLDNLKQEVNKHTIVELENNSVLDLCLMQFKTYQYQLLLQFFKQACLNKNYSQIEIIENLMSKISIHSSINNKKAEFLLNIGNSIVALFNNKIYEANKIFKKTLCISDSTEIEYLLEIINIDWIRELLILDIFQELNSYSYEYTANNDTLIWGKSLFTLPSEFKHNNRLRAQPDLNMLKKADKVMWNTFKSNPFEAVLFYIDLSVASSSTNCIISSLISALSWNIYLLEKTKTKNEFLSKRKLLKSIVGILYELTSKFSYPSAQLVAYKAIFSSLNYSARIALEKFNITKISDKFEIEIIKTCVLHLLDLAIINPIIYSETCYTYDLIFENYVSHELFVKCLVELGLSSITEEIELYLNPSVIRYYIFEGSLRGWYEPPFIKEIFSENKKEAKFVKQIEEDFRNTTRIDCCLAILEEQDYTLKDLEYILNWNLLEKDSNGWYSDFFTSLKFQSLEIYKSINGFQLNFETGVIELIVEKANIASEALFDSNDINEVFANKIDYGYFSLDQFDFTHQYHPLQKMRFNPQVANTNFLLTMLHTDYLLKFFTTGVEVSSKYPFDFKSTIEGLLNRLPSHLKQILLPKHLDDDQENISWSGNAHRFWIKANEIKMFIDDSKSNAVSFFFETPKMRINKHLLKMNSNGELVDDVEGELEDYNSWESKFARNFTKHYDEIAEYFPEFNRLKQLLKLAVCQAYISKNIESFAKNTLEIERNKYSDISEKLTNIRNKIGDWPKSEDSYYIDSKLENIVNEHISNIVNTNDISLTYSEKNEISDRLKNENRSALVKALKTNDDNILNELSNNLKEAFSLNYYNSDLKNLVENYLRDSNRQNELIDYLIESIKSKRERVLQNFKDSIPDKKWYNNQSYSFVNFVPTALSFPTELRIIYGGVILKPDVKPVDNYRDLNLKKQTKYIRFARNEVLRNMPDITKNKQNTKLLKDIIENHEIKRLAKNQEKEIEKFINKLKETGKFNFNDKLKIEQAGKIELLFSPLEPGSFLNTEKKRSKREDKKKNESTRSKRDKYYYQPNIESNNFRGKYFVSRAKEDLKIYRLYCGVKAKSYGGYFSLENYKSIEEARNKLAILNDWNDLTDFYCLEIPKGTFFVLGIAELQKEENGPIYEGGGVQIYFSSEHGLDKLLEFNYKEKNKRKNFVTFSRLNTNWFIKNSEFELKKHKYE